MRKHSTGNEVRDASVDLALWGCHPAGEVQARACEPGVDIADPHTIVVDGVSGLDRRVFLSRMD